MMRDRDATPTLTDAAIKAMFEHRAGRADAFDLRRPILTAAIETSQRRRLAVGLTALLAPRLVRGLILALVAATIVGLVAVGSGAFQTAPAVTGSAPVFVRPFEYTIPGRETLRLLVVRRELVAWSSGPHIETTQVPDAVAPMAPNPYDGRGIYVASGAEPWSHGPSGRFMLRTVPREFIADLRDLAGVDMGDIVDTTLDGRAALRVPVLGTAGSDVHLAGRMQGPNGEFVLVNVPSRLIVADIDGTTIFVLIWARTPVDLAAWLPTAESFIGSIHFDERSQP